MGRRIDADTFAKMSEAEQEVVINETLAALAETHARHPKLMGRIAQAVGGLFGKNGQLDGMSAREREEEARRIINAAFFRVNDPTRTDAEAKNRRAQNRAKADATAFSTQEAQQETQAQPPENETATEDATNAPTETPSGTEAAEDGGVQGPAQGQETQEQGTQGDERGVADGNVRYRLDPERNIYLHKDVVDAMDGFVSGKTSVTLHNPKFGTIEYPLECVVTWLPRK